MRILFLGLLTFLLAFAQQEYFDGVIVLKDGRVLSMRGEIEEIGDEIHFLDQRGELMVLSASMVDLEETHRRNEALRNQVKRAREQSLEDDGSLYAKVKLQQKKEDAKGGQRVQVQTDCGAKPEVKEPTWFPSQPEKSGSQGVFADPQQLERRAREQLEPLRQLAAGYTWALWVLLGLFLLAGLSNLIMTIYLYVCSFQEGAGWWIVLTLVFPVPILLNIGGCVTGFQNPWFVWVAPLLNLVGIFAFPAFILFCCHGRRIRYLFLWGFVYALGILAVAAAILLTWLAS